MKKFNFISLAIILFCLCSCLNPSKTEQGSIEYYPVKFEGDESWSMIDTDGNVLFKDEFKYPPTVAFDGVFSVSEGEGYNIYKCKDKPELLKDCENLKSVGTFKDGMAPITKKHSRIMVIDNNGNTKFTLEPFKGKEITSCAAEFSDGLLRIKTEDKKYGYVDKSGNFIIEPQYDVALDFHNGYAFVAKEIDGGSSYTKSLINKKNEKILTFTDKYRSIYEDDEFLSVRKDRILLLNKDRILLLNKDDDRLGFMNLKGEFNKCPSKVKNINYFNDMIYTFQNDNREWGVMDFEGEQLIRAKYDLIYALPSNNFLAKKDRKYSIIDKTGEEILTFDEDYKDIIPLNNGKIEFLAEDGDLYVVLDKNGKPINKELYQDFIYFNDKKDIDSEYFNTEAMVTDITKEINSDGVNKYKIGDLASKYLKDAVNYKYEYSIIPDSVVSDGYRYDLHIRINTTAYIALDSYNKETYDYETNFNPNAKIESIEFTAQYYDECWDEAKQIFIRELKNKGYKIDSEDKHRIEMSSNVYNLVVKNDNYDNEIRVYITALHPETVFAED